MYHCTPGDTWLKHVAELEQFLHEVLTEEPLLCRTEHLHASLSGRLDMLIQSVDVRHVMVCHAGTRWPARLFTIGTVCSLS